MIVSTSSQSSSGGIHQDEYGLLKGLISPVPDPEDSSAFPSEGIERRPTSYNADSSYFGFVKE